MNIAQFSTSYSQYSTKSAVDIALLKKQLENTSSMVAGTYSSSVNTTLQALDQTEASDPLSGNNTIDISV